MVTIGKWDYKPTNIRFRGVCEHTNIAYFDSMGLNWPEIVLINGEPKWVFQLGFDLSYKRIGNGVLYGFC